VYDLIYRDCRQRITELVRVLPDADLDRQVPACPAWTVRLLVAHLAGAASDVSTGRLDNALSDAWTARHVAEREHRSVADNLAEWERLSPSIERSLAGSPSGRRAMIAHDVTHHEADILGALRAGRPPEQVWRMMLEDAGKGLARRYALPGEFIIDVGDREWRFGEGEPVTSVLVDPYELWRAIVGRRSAAQMAAWKWDGEPHPFIEFLPIFPPRVTDLVEPPPPTPS
jgi:uncharacterized protein (TIGR03083 family)